MRKEGRAFGGIGNVAGHIAAGDRGARSSQLFVSCSMVRMKMRVDDVSNWSVRYGLRKLLHRGDNLIRHLGRARIHQ